MDFDAAHDDIETFMTEHTLHEVTTDILTCYLLLQQQARVYQRIADEVKLGVVAVRKISGRKGDRLEDYQIRGGE